jgi:hypothetical protein
VHCLSCHADIVGNNHEKENKIPVLTTLLTIFASSFVIALSGALMPGPLLTATISECSQRGFIAGPLLITGHAILELVLVIALLSARSFSWCLQGILPMRVSIS